MLVSNVRWRRNSVIYAFVESLHRVLTWIGPVICRYVPARSQHWRKQVCVCCYIFHYLSLLPQTAINNPVIIEYLECWRYHRALHELYTYVLSKSLNLNVCVKLTFLHIYPRPNRLKTTNVNINWAFRGAWHTTFCKKIACYNMLSLNVSSWKLWPNL